MKKEQIENVLNSLDGMEQATPGPFFFTRLKARMERPVSYAERIIQFISRPSIAIAAIMCIIFINAFAMLKSEPVTSQQNASVTEVASVDEYAQLNMSFSEVEKINP